MNPKRHFRLLGLSPLVGVVVFFVGFGVMALSDASLEGFGIATLVSVAATVLSWAAVRYFLKANCPSCGSPMQLKEGEETLVYACPRCPKLVDTGRRVLGSYDP